MHELDRRTDLYRSLRKRFDEIAIASGKQEVAPVRQSLIERFVFLEALIRKLEARAAEEELADKTIGQWVQANNALLGLAKTIGIDAKQPNGQSLESYVNGANA